MVRALLIQNPVTPPNVIQSIARDALWQSNSIFSGMPTHEVDYFIRRFPSLSPKDRLLSLVLRHSGMLMARDVVETFNAHGLSQSLCSLIAQFAMEVSLEARAHKEEKAFTRLAPFLFDGILMFDMIDETTFYSHLADAKLNHLHADLTPVGSLIHFANATYAFSLSIKSHTQTGRLMRYA